MISVRTFAAFVIATVSANAQPPSPGARSVAAGHIHLNSADPDAAIAFWKDVIGTATYTNQSLTGVSTLGVTILFNHKAPSGPSAGSAIDHLAFKVPDLQPFSERLAKTAFKSFHPQSDEYRLMVDGPDGVRIELIEDNTMYAPLEFSHVHLYAANPAEMQAWYPKNLGGRPGNAENPDAVQLPGAQLIVTRADHAVPSVQRAIDHLSFEVKDLAGFCGALAASGIKIDVPPHASPELNATTALFTDPWGTRIELMEKAAR